MPECTCDKCVACCHNTPGIPTADQALAMLDAGLARKMMLRTVYHEGPDEYPEVEMLVPAVVGKEGKEVGWLHFGTCTLLVDNRCSIHATKPLECAEALGCRREDAEQRARYDAVRDDIVYSWHSGTGQVAIERWRKEVGECSTE